MIDRKINVEELSDDQLRDAISKIAEKINEEVDRACENANKLLKRYGMTCKMQIVIDQEDR